MKKILNILTTLLILMSNIGCTSSQAYSLQNGDVIFHTSLSSQSKLIQEATNSNLSHVGIIYMRDGKPYVFEAVGPVKITPLDEWIYQGKDNKYKVSKSLLLFLKHFKHSISNHKSTNNIDSCKYNCY